MAKREQTPNAQMKRKSQAIAGWRRTASSLLTSEAQDRSCRSSIAVIPIPQSRERDLPQGDSSCSGEMVIKASNVRFLDLICHFERSGAMRNAVERSLS